MALDNIARKYFKESQMKEALTQLPESVTLEGGVIRGKGGMVVDGTFTKTTFISDDETPMYFTSLSSLTDCVVNCHDALFEGQFTGTINCKGDKKNRETSKIEFGSGSITVGVFNKDAEVFMHVLADLDDLKTKTAKRAETSESTQTLHTPFTGLGLARTGTEG
jgi:hypothetical protein